MVTYCIETAVLEATRPIGAKAVAVANKANKAASLNIIIIFDKSILIVRTNDLFFPPNLGTSICMTSGPPIWRGAAGSRQAPRLVCSYLAQKDFCLSFSDLDCSN